MSCSQTPTFCSPSVSTFCRWNLFFFLSPVGRSKRLTRKAPSVSPFCDDCSGWWIRLWGSCVLGVVKDISRGVCVCTDDYFSPSFVGEFPELLISSVYCFLHLMYSFSRQTAYSRYPNSISWYIFTMAQKLQNRCDARVKH